MVANPLILLSPKINKMIAAIKVVILASIILFKEPLFPFLQACDKLFPLYNSSLILAKLITVASIAMPMPITIAAIPGSVKTPPTNQKTKSVTNV